MKTVRAKFKCTSIEEYETGSKSVKLNVVYGNSEENKQFSKYTPSGSVTIGVDSETPAVNFFKPGKEYFLDFTEVE